MSSIFQLNPTTYQRHLIHGEGRIWAETNCYVDVWVELLHAWGFEPIAALPFTLTPDFEGDQWTFFKFRHGDLLDLYQLDVQELAIWKPLTTHIDEQISLGRPVLVELDSFFLPDTVGTAYQTQHVKSTVAAVAIDVHEHRLGYFHNQSYHQLQGDDFLRIFRIDGRPDPSILPPYVEFVKHRGAARLSMAELAKTSMEILREQLALTPSDNPFTKFKASFARDFDWLVNQPVEMFHQYSFATLRQFGACFELAATYLGWLQGITKLNLEGAAQRFLAISEEAKSMQFQLARAMMRKRPMDLTTLDEMGEQWEAAHDQVRRVLGSSG